MEHVRHKIVLVDDNLATLQQGKMLLQTLYRVYTVQSGAILFENLEHDRPDLILLDVEMPEMDGFEVITKLKADVRYKDIPVIFLTSKSDEESERKGFSLGAVDYITKPFSGPLLQKRISNQILYMRVKDAVEGYSHDLDLMVDELAKANERAKILMEKTPLCVRLWSRDAQVIDCNEVAIKLFGFKNKQDCLERHTEVFPEYQPCGQPSVEKIKNYIEKTLKDGACEFEWVFKMFDGTDMPALVMLVRVEYENDYAIAAYTRDMREYHNMMHDIAYHNTLLEAVNRAATILINSDITSFENDLYASMKMLAQTISFDRVRIWKNSNKDDGLYCTVIYGWAESTWSLHDKEKASHLSYNRQLPGWEEILSSGTSIYGAIHQMPKEIQALLSSQGIISLLVLPVVIENQFWGYVSFENCHCEHSFTGKDESIMQSCGMLFVQAILRNEMANNVQATSLKLMQAMEIIVEDEERMRLMLDAMPFACRLFGKDYRFIDCNQEAMNLVGVNTKEEYRKRQDEIMPEFQPCGRLSHELRMEYLEKAFEEGLARFEWSYQKLDGEMLPCEITMVRVMLKGENIIAGYARDLREQKSIIEEIRRAEIAEERNKAKSDFLASMSHEIRTPMNSIIGFAELALDMSNINLAPEIQIYLKKIKDSAVLLLHIINDILDIAKIESGTIELECKPFDLYDILMRCQSTISPIAKQKSLELKIHAEQITGKIFLGDHIRLYQVFMNLLSNAVKFTDSGTVTFTSRIKNTSDNYMTVYFEVKDSGIGIEPELITKIFEPFTQADSGTTRKYSGTGLGLTITSQIIKLLGGTLSVESNLGAGSVFSFEITFDTVDRPIDFYKYELVEAPQKIRFDNEILVCDDNYMNQEVITHHLSRLGIRTVIANNGKIALEIVQERLQKGEKPFDLIFMDIFMPVMDGLEAATKIKAIADGIPIVAMTANIMAAELENYKKKGMPDCLAKPFMRDDLLHVLVKYLTPVNTIAGSQTPKECDDMQKMLQRSFIKINQAKYVEFIEAIEAGDIKLAHRMAHTLQGNAGQIGKPKLQKVAGEIEAFLNQGTLPIPEDKLYLFKNELELVIAELQPLLDELEPQEISHISSEQILLLFNKLERLLESGNADCLHFLDDVRKVPGAEKLAEQIDNFDFKIAAQTLAKLKSTTCRRKFRG